MRKCTLKTFFLRPNARQDLSCPFVHQCAALQPAVDAEAYPNIGAVCDSHRLLIAVKAAENAPRHAAQAKLGRIVWMDSNADTLFFSHGHNLRNEVAEVFPNLLLAVDSSVG